MLPCRMGSASGSTGGQEGLVEAGLEDRGDEATRFAYGDAKVAGGLDADRTEGSFERHDAAADRTRCSGCGLTHSPIDRFKMINIEPLS